VWATMADTRQPYLARAKHFGSSARFCTNAICNCLLKPEYDDDSAAFSPDGGWVWYSSRHHLA